MTSVRSWVALIRLGGNQREVDRMRSEARHSKKGVGERKEGNPQARTERYFFVDWFERKRCCSSGCEDCCKEGSCRSERWRQRWQEEGQEVTVFSEASVDLYYRMDVFVEVIVFVDQRKDHVG